MKLPLNCSVEYITNFLSKSESKALYDELIEIHNIDQLTEVQTENGNYTVNYGKLMFMDEALIQGNHLPEVQWGKGKSWSPTMKQIKERVEKLIQRTFHVCVCIYYPDGNSGVDFHADLAAFGDTSVIPSLSIGEEREFQLRENETSDIYELQLAEGSLLIMGENCQERYEHSLPVNSDYKKGRINLTFRTYGFN
jgi:alkylated DNA repair dioxygenase AlkB